KSNHTFFETLKKRFYFVKKITDANQNLSLPFRLNGDSVKLLKNVLNNFQCYSASNFALDALLDNGLTFIARKLFGRYGIKGFSLLDSFAGAKLSFSKLFKKFRYYFKQSFINVLICLTTKTTATKYRTLRIIVFKKGQINKVPIIALLKIDNLLQRERVANIYIKQKKGNVRFGGRFIKIESVAAAFVTRFTLFFGEGFFAAAIKARRKVTGKTFAGILKGCKRKRAR
ncbi:hypothetical protein GGTG_11846, partial [Gaeumannomyces tritici R3-111a-1]